MELEDGNGSKEYEQEGREI
jgi:hypothetical protein